MISPLRFKWSAGCSNMPGAPAKAGAQSGFPPSRGHMRERYVLIQKLYPDAAAALDCLLHDGMTICAGGFGLCGIPERLIDAI